MKVQDVVVGMRVVCMDAIRRDGVKNRHLTVGKVYEVLRVDVQDKTVRVMGDHGERINMFAKRFEPAPDVARAFAVGDIVKERNNPNEYRVLEVNEGNKIVISTAQDHNKRLGEWNADLFVVVRKANVVIPAPAPVPKHPFAVGDVLAERAYDFGGWIVEKVLYTGNVHLRPTEEQMKKRGTLDKVFTGYNDAGYAPDMFKLFAPKIEYSPLIPFEVGAVVKLVADEEEARNAKYINPGYVGERFLGQMVTIKKAIKQIDGSHWYELEECDEYYVYAHEWFEDTRGQGAAIIVQPRAVLAVGDKVQITKREEQAGGFRCKWTAEMEGDLNSYGTVAEFDDKRGIATLTNGWSYLVECLTKVDAIPKKAKVLKKPAQNLRAFLAEARKKHIKNVRGMCSYTVVMEAEGKLREYPQIGDVCHARLRQNNTKLKPIVAVIDFQNDYEKRVSSKLGFKKFADYVVNRSPWAIAFKGKTIKNILLTGADINVNAPAGVVAGACIALRMGREYHEMAEHFEAFLKLFKREDVAFLMAFSFQKEGKKYVSRAMGGGHEALSGLTPAGSMLSFFANGYSDAVLAKPAYAVDSNYRVFEAVDATPDKVGIKDGWRAFIGDKCEGKLDKAGWSHIKTADEEQLKAFGALIAATIDKAKA